MARPSSGGSSLPRPVIAVVNGFALGGGCELALACHVRIASTNARFGLPEVGLGIIPGYGGTVRLARVVGLGRAVELTLTGAQVKAEEAERIGLVTHVVEPEALMDRARELAGQMAPRAPWPSGWRSSRSTTPRTWPPRRPCATRPPSSASWPPPTTCARG
jgi:enoyl-CoA hydratase